VLNVIFHRLVVSYEQKKIKTTEDEEQELQKRRNINDKGYYGGCIKVWSNIRRHVLIDKRYDRARSKKNISKNSAYFIYIFPKTSKYRQTNMKNIMFEHTCKLGFSIRRGKGIWFYFIRKKSVCF